MTAAPRSQHPDDPQDHTGLGVVPRPGTVTAGAILAWIGSAALVAYGAAQIIQVAVTDNRGVTAGMDGTVSLTGAVVLVAGGLGLLLTTLAFRGSRGALIALTVLAVLCALAPLAAVVYLLATTDATLPLPTRALGGTVVAGTAIALFWSGRSWFRARRRH